MIGKIFDLIGSAMCIVLLAYIIVDIKNNKELNRTGLVGRIICMIILFVILLRT